MRTAISMPVCLRACLCIWHDSFKELHQIQSRIGVLTLQLYTIYQRTEAGGQNQQVAVTKPDQKICATSILLITEYCELLLASNQVQKKMYFNATQVSKILFSQHLQLQLQSADM